MKLYLVRHGETEENASKTIQGQLPGILSPLGLQQRERLALRLQPIPFDIIYCSDLKRTRDTLEPLLKESSPPTHYREDIRERSFGELEGKPGKDYLTALSRAGESRVQYRPTDGENFFDLQTRTDRFLKEIQEKHLGQTVLVMSHGGTIRAMISTLLEYSLDETLRLDIKNTSLSIFEIAGDRSIESHTLNEHSHLDGLQTVASHSSGVDFVSRD